LIKTLAKTKRRKGKGKSGQQQKRGATSAPLLSVCLIARDEATFIGRCLASIAEIANEIIVVDTGSTDETSKIAQSYGARVLSFPWSGDFSAARNFGLDAAQGRWILSLDCDEVIATEDHAEILSAMARMDVIGYRMTTRNYCHEADCSEWHASDGKYAEQKTHSGWFPTTKVRLWRHTARHRFRGAVHELVEASILESGGQLGDCMLPVHHYGLVEKERAADRYVEAGERKLEASPEDQRARYELAIAYRDAGRFADALQQIEHVTTSIDGEGIGDHLYLEEENVHLVHGDILDRSQRLDEALGVYQQVAERHPKTFQAHNNAGNLLVRLGRFDEARMSYRRAVELAPDNKVIAENLRKLEQRLSGHSISLCIIVKDGAKDLHRCLSSVKAAVDEIIVVDTGSTDNSVSVAKEHGARVEFFEWCDNFAAARNASLALATGEWILWMDVDDYLLAEDLEKIQRARQLTPDIALSFSLVNTGGADTSRFRQVKMFPNRQEIRFLRPVHETVLPALQAAGIEVRTTDVNVMHTGYADPAIVRQKSARYRQLMERWIETHPDDLDVWFRLGHTAYADGLREDALVRFERVLAAGDDLRPKSLRRHAFLFRGRCRLESGDWQSSIGDFEMALQMDDTDVFAHVSLGDALTKAGRHADAVRHLRLGISGQLDGTFPLDRAVIDYTAHYFLGESLSALGRVDEAVEALEAASRAQPDRPEARQALSQLRPSLAGGRSTESPSAFVPPVATDESARLTLCMIVCDEESRLAECLDSARDAVDEIVVIDTGSSDKTVEIAQRYGAKMGYFEWCDDFSAARNESLKLATGDWILWLDADDRLPAEYVQTIRQLIAGPRDRGYFFVLDDQGYESVSCLQMRLFPNIPGVNFEMPIHEQVTPSLAKLGIEMVPTPVRVVHTGYTTPEVVSAKKDRYLGIMEGWLQDHPEDYIVRSHMALTYHTTGRLEEAAEQYRMIVEESTCRQDRNFVILTTALLFLGRSWQKLGDLDVALDWLRQAEQVDRNYVLTQYSLAEVLLEQGQAEEAVQYAQGLLTRDQQQLTFFPIDQRELHYSTLHVLGRAQGILGQVAAAADSLRQASKVPVARRSEALGQLSEIYKAAGDRDAAMLALADALEIDPQSPRHLFNVGMLHLETSCYDDARLCFEQVLAIVGERRTDARIRALLNLGFIAKTQGDVNAAEARYNEVLQLDPDHADARANLGHLYLNAARYTDAVLRFEEVLSAQPGLLDIELGLLSARLSLGQWEPDRARQILLGVPEAGAIPKHLTLETMAEPFLQLGAALTRRNLPGCAEMAFLIALGEDRKLDEATQISAAALRAHRCLGEIYFSQGRFWDAVSQYEVVLRGAPGDTEAFRRLGDTYARLGVDDAARMCYARSSGQPQ
jgi:glycosyltransferase involved in cell wall biosynthesis/Tfp pilus assembly protein PilF